MKALMSLSLALVLALVAASASASGKHKHNDKYQKDRHVSVQHGYSGGHKYRNQHRRHHYYDQRRNHRYQHHYRHRHYYNGYRGGYWHYRRPGYYYPWVGAAITGTILGHSLYHLHGDNVCYDDHDRRGDRYRSSTEVVGCHRIEQLPDGSERRVDVPLSQCN